MPLCAGGPRQRRKQAGAEEMVQQLKALITLAEDLCSVLSTHTAVHNHPSFSSDLHAYTWYKYIYTKHNIFGFLRWGFSLCSPSCPATKKQKGNQAEQTMRAS